MLLSVNKAQDNHNGGNLHFGPDGYLYLGLGDGGGGGDPQENAQNPMRLLGKMLRIDVNSRRAARHTEFRREQPFAGNPRCNVDGTRLAELPGNLRLGLAQSLALELRPRDRQLWVRRRGPGPLEEIDIVERGGNYGWDMREGAHCFEPETMLTGGLIDPVAEYDRTMR